MSIELTPSSYIAEKEEGAGLGGDTLTGHIDCVIVSHFHLDHCGALPFMTEMVCTPLMARHQLHIQGGPSGSLKPHVDLVPTLLAAGGPPMELPTAQGGWPNIPNLKSMGGFNHPDGHPVTLLKV